MVISENQINSSMRLHITPENGYHLKNLKLTNTGVKDMLIRGGWECQRVQPLWDNMRFLTSLQTHVPYDPAILFLGIHSKKIKSAI